MISKKILNTNSKTHKFGYLIGVFGGLLSFLPAAKEFISPELYGYIFMGVSVAVIVLRNVTTTAIEEK